MVMICDCNTSLIGMVVCVVSAGLANMDAIELDMRIRLAELQRQYREKQRELAKLQPKKDKE